MSVGIVGYGAYVPEVFIEPAVFDGRARRLGLVKKAVAAWDEDSVTMAVEAGRAALFQARVRPERVGAVYVGSESPPYAVNPSSTIVADILGVQKQYRAVDLQFACKAATAGLAMAMAEVAQQHTTHSMVIGADKSQAKQGDPLEWSAGAAAAAMVVGRERVIATVADMLSLSSDTPDFWRRAGELYPSHGGRFTGEPGYFAHVIPAAQLLMRRLALKPTDFDYVVMHMPNGVFPQKAARALGFGEQQWRPGMVVTEVGNPYSASALLGLCAVLEVAKPRQRILMVAYGSGAGADSIVLETTGAITRLSRGNLRALIHKRTPIDMAAYLERERWE